MLRKNFYMMIFLIFVSMNFITTSDIKADTNFNQPFISKLSSLSPVCDASIDKLGDKVAFTVERNMNNYDVYLINSDGTGLKKIYRDCTLPGPTSGVNGFETVLNYKGWDRVHISPDGNTVAFRVFEIFSDHRIGTLSHGISDDFLYVYNVATGNYKLIHVIPTPNLINDHNNPDNRSFFSVLNANSTYCGSLCMDNEKIYYLLEFWSTFGKGFAQGLFKINNDGSEVTQLLGPIYINGCEDGSIEPVWDKDTPCYNPLQPILSGKTLLFGGKSSSINFIEEPSRLFLMNTSSKGEIKGPISKVVIKGSNNWQIGNNVIIGRPDINSNWKIINGNMDEIKTNLNGILSKNGKIFFVESIYNKESKNVLGLHFTDSGKIVEVNLSDLETTLGIESWGRIYSVSYDGSKIIVPYKNGTSMYLSLISFTDR